MIAIFKRLILVVGIGGVIACRSGPPAVEMPASLSFRPTRAGADLWLATPLAIEITTEHDARELEALDATYIGEIRVSDGRVRRSSVALIAAESGATHFRVVTASDSGRVDIVLHRVEPDQWTKLPAPLRPASPTASL